MLSHSTPLLKVLIVVLTLAVLILVGAFVRLVVVGASPATPRTELERAVFAAEEAVKANPEDPTARFKLAAAYVSQGGHQAAVEQAQLGIRLAPSDPSGYYILGLAQVGAGDLQGAIENLKKAVNTEGQLAGFYQDANAALARALDQSGDVEGAISHMQGALSNGPENTLLLFELGQLYERNGKWMEALENYGWALGYVPDYEPAREAFDRLALEHPEALEELQKAYSEETTGAPVGETGVDEPAIESDQ